MSHRLAAVLLFTILAAPCTVAASPSMNYLSPTVKFGDLLKTVFSETISIKGGGFDEYVTHTSETVADHVLATSSEAIRMQEDYRYDGRPAGKGAAEVRDQGSTMCFNGRTDRLPFQLIERT